MTAKEYARKHFHGFPTYQKIAKDAFNAGLENAKPDNVKELEKKLKDTKAELDSLWKTLEDPVECGELLAGM